MTEESVPKFVSVDIMGRFPPEKRAEIKAKWILANDIEVCLEDKGLTPADVTEDPQILALVEETVSGDVLSLTFDEIMQVSALVWAAKSKITDLKPDNDGNNRHD